MSKLTIQKVASSEDRTLPVFKEFEEIADKIRVQIVVFSKLIVPGI